MADPLDVRSAFDPPARILGVDDDAVARHLLERNLARCGYSVEMAPSVDAAQALVESHPTGFFDCVITDYQMPGQNGLDLLLWLRQHDPTIATIMVAGAGEKELVAKTLRSGASNYLDKPYRREDLQSAVDEAVHITRTRRNLARTAADAAAVGRVQRQLLGPGSREIRQRVLFCHHPLSSAGGDFLTVFELPDDEALVLAADVSGHDLKAAFVSAYFQGIVRGMIEKRTPVAEILDFFNRCLLNEWRDDESRSLQVPISLSVCAAIIHPRTHSATLLSSGFPDAHVVDTAGHLSPCGAGGGYPLGWFEGRPAHAVDVALPENGWLALWTDGLEDHALATQVSPWSLAYALIARGDDAALKAAQIRNAADDILVALVPGGSVSLAEGFPILDERYSGSMAPEIDKLQEFWRRSLLLVFPEAPEDCLHECLLCLREAMLNALIHGCARSENQFASLRLVYSRRDHLLRAIIDDPGKGHAFDWQQHEKHADDSLIDRHRGLSLIHHFARHVHTCRNGASLTLELSFP